MRTMRRICIFFIACVLLGGGLSLPAVHADAVQDGDFTYMLNMDNTFRITEYSGTDTEVVIPSEFDGTPVTAIGSNAFDQSNNPGQPKLTKVTIPSSVTAIYDYAFAHNALTSVEIPSVTRIGRGAFQYNQLQSVTLGKVTFLDEYAFADNQLKSVTIPDSLDTIGSYAFQNNRLSSVSLPEGLKIIDYNAFAGNQLTTLQIPKSVTAIYSGAFMNNSLGDVAIPPEVNLGSGDDDPVFDNPVSNNNSNVILYFPKSSVSVFNHASKYRINIIPCNYKITYDGNGNTGGTPPSNTSYVCYNQVFKVPTPDPDQDPNALTKTGYTFKGWNTKPDGSGTNYFGGNYPIIYGIHSGGFTLYANWALNSYQVTFDTGGGTPVAAQTVGYGEHAAEPVAPSRTDYDFEGWYRDSGYSQPWDFSQDTVSGDMTLYAKWKWNGSATIASVELTTDSGNVTGGDTLTVAGVVKDDAGLPVANAVVNLESTSGNWKSSNVSRASVTTGANGEFSADWTAPFVEDPASATITASVDGTDVTPDSRSIQIVPSEKSNALLSGLSLGEGSLSPDFSGDTLDYTTADVGNVVTSLAVTATTASSLSKLTINGTTAVSGSAVNVPLQTGENKIMILVAAEDGIHTRTYTISVRRAYEATSGDYTYSLDNSGGGNGITILGYNGSDTDTDTDLHIPETIDGYVVTEIGTGAFASKNLASVSIPNTVTAISNYAFQNNLLTAVTLPQDLTSIGDYAFSGNKLSSVVLPEGVTTVYRAAFENNQITALSIPSSVTLLDDYSFHNNLLEEVTFVGDGLQKIGINAFADNQLSSVILPKTVSLVDSQAFYNNKLTQAILPATLTLGSDVFGGQSAGKMTMIFPSDTDLILYAENNFHDYKESYYHIQYDGNGQTDGSTPTDVRFYDYYSTATIQQSGSLKRTGYVFRGWNTEKDGSGQELKAGESHEFKRIDGDITLYAEWEPESYSVSYETGGGTVIPATTAHYGDHLDAPTTTPSKAGYRFAGWYRDLNDATTEWNFNQNTVDGDMTLYAKWEAKQLAVSLTASSTVVLGGKEIMVTGTVYDDNQAPQAGVSVRLSSSIDGGMWSLTEASEATVTTDANGAFVASWKAPPVSDATTGELLASLEGSNLESATVQIQVNPLLDPIPSSDADLAALTISDGDLTPEFQAGVTSYTANVRYTSGSVTIVPEVSDQAATVTVDGNVVNSGQSIQVNLNVGPNLVTIVVTAEDGTTQTYDVTITRASAPIVTIPVARIAITSVFSSVYEGDTVRMFAIVSPDDATNKQVSWSVQNGTGAATIDEQGLLTAQKPGIVTVKATAQDGSGIVGSLEITIKERQQGGGGDSPSTPDPTPPSTPPSPPTPPTVPPAATPPVLHVVPGKPPVDVNDADAIQVMLEALKAKWSDSQSTNVPAFSDTVNHWAADSIRLFARLGIVQGYNDGTFKPDASITRGEFASMIVKLFPLTEGSAALPDFTDLGDSWAREAIQTLASNGMISGYDDGTFRADRNITRAEMVAILARVVNLAAVKQAGTVNLRDIDHDWAQEQIQQAANAGIISGRGGNEFAPKQNATRAEALTVLLRAISLSPEIQQLLEGMK